MTKTEMLQKIRELENMAEDGCGDRLFDATFKLYVMEILIELINRQVNELSHGG